MKRLSLMFVTVMLLAIFLTGTGFCWPDYIKGRPSFAPGSDRGYFIWHDGSNWLLRTTTKGGTHVFHGRINSNGQIRVSKRLALEKGDYVRATNGGKTLEFRLTTKGVEDGFNFVTSGSTVTFLLLADGKKCPRKFINGGSGSKHPTANPFTISK